MDNVPLYICAKLFYPFICWWTPRLLPYPGWLQNFYESLSLKLCYFYAWITHHTHTHTHIYIYIYIYKDLDDHFYLANQVLSNFCNIRFLKIWPWILKSVYNLSNLYENNSEMKDLKWIITSSTFWAFLFSLLERLTLNHISKPWVSHTCDI